MKNKSFKKVMAFALAATMVLGGATTAFAEDTSGVQEGTGTYEGGEMKYPTLSVTLPTIPAGTYDYIADPNGLIADTSAAHYDGATFTGNSGIFFKTTDAAGETKATYTNKSKALTLQNENAQDLDVTIKLEQKTAGSDEISYSDSASFETDDKGKKLFLAVTDNAETNAKVDALSSTKAATLTTKVDGTKGNYKPSYNESTGYGYVLDETKKVDGAYQWASCTYALTGALNTNAEWEDDLTFPAIKVTWSYAEHQDNAAPSISTLNYDYDRTATLPITLSFGVGDLAATQVASVAWSAARNGDYTVFAANANKYSVSGTTLTFNSGTFGTASVNDHRFLKITFNDSANTAIILDLTITQ